MANVCRNGTVPIIHDDEALLSVLKRLGDYHQLYTVSALTAAFGVVGDVRGLPTGDKIMALCAAMPEIASALKRMSLPKHDEGYHQFYGSFVHRYHLRFDRVRYCPFCLVDGAYLRQAWHLAAINVCHVHSVRLIKRCDCCGAAISLNRSSICYCTECGADFRDAVTERADPLEVEAVGDLLALCQTPGVLAQRTIVAVLNGLNLGGAVELITMLGRFACAADGLKPGEGRPLTWPHASQLISKGYELLKSWPHGFHALISRKMKDARASESLNALFGASYKSLARLSSTPWGCIVYPEFKTAVDTCRHLGPQSSQKCSMVAIQREFSVKEHTLDRVRRQLISTGENLRGKQMQVEAVRLKIAQHRASRATLCNLAEMGSLLGLTTKAQIKKVADARVFGEQRPDHVSDQRSRFFLRSEIQAFLEAVSVCVEPDDNSWRIARWDEVLQMAGQRKLGMAGVLQALTQKILRPVFIDADAGLPGLVFNHAQAKKALDKVSADQTGSISVRELAKRVGVSPRVAYKLVRDGHLSSRKLVDGREEIRVSASSVDHFLKRHVSVNELSQRLGVSRVRLKKELQSVRGRQPSVIFEKDGPQFFLRSACSPEDLGMQTPGKSS